MLRARAQDLLGAKEAAACEFGVAVEIRDKPWMLLFLRANEEWFTAAVPRAWEKSKWDGSRRSLVGVMLQERAQPRASGGWYGSFTLLLMLLQLGVVCGSAVATGWYGFAVGMLACAPLPGVLARWRARLPVERATFLACFGAVVSLYAGFALIGRVDWWWILAAALLGSVLSLQLAPRLLRSEVEQVKRANAT